MILQQDIEIIEVFKRCSPWSGTFERKREKFLTLLNNLCMVRSIEIPKLLIHRDHKRFKWARANDGDCWFNQKKIRIRRFSVLTLLHEFKHWNDMKGGKSFNGPCKKQREWEAVYYSTYLFYRVWPERLKHLSDLMTMRVENIKLSESQKENASLVALIDLIVKGK